MNEKYRLVGPYETPEIYETLEIDETPEIRENFRIHQTEALKMEIFSITRTLVYPKIFFWQFQVFHQFQEFHKFQPNGTFHLR